MYTLYHIPKRKEWGCTKYFEKRISNLGYQLSDVVETIIETDIDIASELEKELNIRDGYGWNSSRDYRLMVKRAYKSNEIQSQKKLKASNLQGIIQGNINKVNGHMAKMQSLGGKATTASDQWKVTSAVGGHTQSQLIHICPHCGKEGKGNAMFQHHFNKCKTIKKI
jgi:hypothetical protein